MSDPTKPQSQSGDDSWQVGGAPPPPSAGGSYQQSSPPQGGYQQAPPPQGGYQQPGQPYAQSGSKVGRPGELLDRFLARLIDHVILFAVNMVLVGFLIVGALMGGGGGGLFGGGNFLNNVVGAVLGAALYLGYFAFMESSRGQTIGKMVLKLETRGANGGHPTMEEALKRNAWVALSLLGIIPLIGAFVAFIAQLGAMIFIAMGINTDAAGRRGWHDKFAGTQVIKVG